MSKLFLPRADVHSGPLVLVNAEHPIAAQQESPALGSLGGAAQEVLLERRMIPPFLRLMNAVGGWAQIGVVSGWRSKQTQQEIYERSLTESGESFTKQFVALPNHSEHQTGFAVDLGIKSENMDLICPSFPDSGACLAFRKQAPLHGLIERYPKGKERITQISHEPWHFRYVGFPHAVIISQLALTLEEYIDYVKQFPAGGDSLRFPLEQGTIALTYYKAESAAQTMIETNPRNPFSISGNNVDGFILTEWRTKHDRTK